MLINLIGDPNVVVGFLDLWVSTKLVRRHSGHVSVHGVVGVSATLATLKGLRPSFDAGLKQKQG